MATTNEYLEIDTGFSGVNAATFTASGEYLVSGSDRLVRMWRVNDGEQVATMAVEGDAICVAASNNGKLIAGGTRDGEVLVWNARTHEKVFANRNGDATVLDVDFSPDSMRLVSASARNGAATIWDIVTCQRVRTLKQKALVAKYSPQGDKIATATYNAVSIWDSNDGRLLIEIPMPVQRWRSLVWHTRQCVFVQARDGTIKRINAFTGLTVSEWSIPDADNWSCVALSQRGQFVAYSAKKTMTFWDTTSLSRHSSIPHTHDIRSIACSSDGLLLAVAAERKIIVKTVSSVVFSPISEPELDIDSVVLNAWKYGQLTNAESLLSAAIPTSESRHHVLASRALVRARLGRWNEALVDAEESIEIQQSVIGYIAKCATLIGKGAKNDGFRVCDIACLQFHSKHVVLLRLIKAVSLFMAGSHAEAISHVDYLITTPWVGSTLHVVRAYMDLLLANKHLESGRCEQAIRLFKAAQFKLRIHTHRPPLVVSLVSGWCFDDLAITIHRGLSEALLAAGRLKEASESALHMVDPAINILPPEFKCRCHSKLGDSAMNVGQYDEAISQYTAALSLNPTAPQDLLLKRSNARMGKGALEDALNDAKEWVRLMLISGSWRDALVAAGFTLEKSLIYRAICNHLETTGRITDAVACFHQMSSEPIQKIDREQQSWIRDFKFRCRNKLEGLGDGAVNVGQYTEAISRYTAAMSLDPVGSQPMLVKRCNAWLGKGAREDALNDAEEWARFILRSGSWNDALVAAVDVRLGRFTIYQAVCERLEMTGRVVDAVACFRQMHSESPWAVDRGQANWAGDFKSRCRGELGDLGDMAMKAKQYDEAVSHYTTAMSLGSPIPQDLLVKRSNAWVRKGAREDALSDAKEWVRLMLTSGSWKDALAAAVDFTLERFTIYQAVCERLETAGRVSDAIVCFHQMYSESSWAVDGGQADWARDFKSRCRRNLGDLGDMAMKAEQYDEAVSHYTTAMSLSSPIPQDLLVKRSNAWMRKGAQEDALSDAKEWAGLMLTSGSWQDVLACAVDFALGRFMIYRAVCERLEATGHVTDAVVCFHQMSSEPEQEIGKGQNWTRDFKSKCCVELEDLGDSAAKAEKYGEAILLYTSAISLDPPSSQDLLAKRSKACAERGLWEDALNDANKMIELNPSSLSGHERKYVALLGMGRHSEATDIFETMLSKMSESSDPSIRDRSSRYVHPGQTKNAIRESIQNVIRDSPLVLIDTLSGRLCDKSQQASAFESTPAFATLVASMVTAIDYARINQEVGEFYRYATLSHTWEGNELLYEKVVEIVVYDLKTLSTYEKLKTFCKIVRDHGFKWAWCDTCCIDKRDHFVLQEALIRMFKWYEGSAMTIIFLCDVDRLAKLGALTRSRWNSRGWTFQEYHASKVVRIYTKDWTPYLGLTIFNYKESPEIILEMEQATDISAQALIALRPGLSDIREKLRLASRRKTTRVEDAAYSLLGIFSMSLPVTYGEGDKALGRLLSQLLMSSGDTSILAWNGRSGSFNSCLPADIIVFGQPLTPYIPTAIQDTEMATIITELRTSSLDLDPVKRLYDKVKELPKPIFAGQRMMLPCLVFEITTLTPSRNESGVLHAQAGVLGAVEIKTIQNLTQLHSPCLIYPWIDILLDRHAAGNTVDTVTKESLPSSSQIESLPQVPIIGRPPPPTTLPTQEGIRLLQFIARLKQPFGVLLLSSPWRNAAEYRRIAAEDLIRVQVGQITPAVLEELIQSVRVLDVL